MKKYIIFISITLVLFMANQAAFSAENTIYGHSTSFPWPLFFYSGTNKDGDGNPIDNNGNKVPLLYQKNIAGKTTQSAVMQPVYGDLFYQYSIHSTRETTSNITAFRTVESNICLDGSGTGFVRTKIPVANSGDKFITIINIASDNTITSGVDGVSIKQAAKTFTRNEWHRVVFTADAQNECIYVYLDSELINTISCPINGHYLDYVRWNVSQNSRMGLCDVKYYDSAYDPMSDKIVAENSDDLIVDSELNTVYSTSDIDSTVLKLKTATNAQNALKSDNSTIVLISSDGYSYYYYKYSNNIEDAKKLEVSGTNLIISNGNVSASSIVTGMVTNDVSLYLAKYDSIGMLKGLTKKGADINSRINKLEINEKENTEYTYKAFLWSDMKPLSNCINAIRQDGEVLVNTGFENGERIPCMIASSRYGNILNTTFDNGNTVALLKQTTSNSFHLDTYLTESHSDFSTYEYDFKLVNENSEFSIMLKDTSDNYSAINKISHSGITIGDRIYPFDISVGDWHRISETINFNNRTRTIYIDNTIIAENINIENNSFRTDDNYVYVMRIYVDSHNEEKYSQLLIDNIRAYEEEQPFERIGDFNYKLDLSKNSVFSDADYITAEEIKTSYKGSVLSGIHPRIQINDEIIDNIKNSDDSYISSARNKVISAANEWLTKIDIIYSFNDSNPMLAEAREVLDAVYTLGMAYNLTGNVIYAERGKKALMNVCSFGDWMPNNHLTVAEMSTAVSIGYDWLYNYLSDDEREIIEKAIYKNAVYDDILAYQSEYSPMNNAMYNNMNHNVVCNSGAFVTAMAFMDVYPNECSYLAEEALRGFKISLQNFAPVGVWFEGPHYWEYTMQYLTKMMSASDVIFGDNFGIDETVGLSTSAKYMMAMQSPVAIFNYGDGMEQSLFVPEIMYLADKYRDADTITELIKTTSGEMLNNEDMVLSLIWYNADLVNDTVNLKKNVYFPQEEVASMRSSWDKENQTFVGMRAGKLSDTHSDLDAGSFVFDSDGIRWIKDYGMGDYSANGYFDKSEGGQRWRYFVKRAEAHNTAIINPTENNEFPIDYDTRFTYFNEDSSTAIMDLTSAQRRNANSARRGFKLDDEKLIVRDEINVTTQNSTLYWFLQTDANVTVAGNTAILSKEGKSKRIEIETNAENYELSYERAAPLSSHNVSGNSVNANRIMLKLNNVYGSINITALIADINDMSTVSEYSIPLAMWEGSKDYSDLGLVSDNPLIDVSTYGVIGAYSNPSNSSYTATASVLKNALQNSTGGYKLSVVDSEMREIVSGTTLMKNGYYLKGTKNDKIIYVPIVTNTEVEKRETAMFLSALDKKMYMVTNGTTLAEEGGIGGKSNDDTSATFRLTSDIIKGTSMNTSWPPRIQRNGLSTDGIYTYEFSVFSDGNATALIAMSGGKALFSINGGEYSYNNDGTMVSGTAANGWHDITITFDKPRGRCHIYLDKTLLTNTTHYMNGTSVPYLTELRFCVDSGLSGGIVAYDNFRIYKGFIK